MTFRGDYDSHGNVWTKTIILSALKTMVNILKWPKFHKFIGIAAVIMILDMYFESERLMNLRETLALLVILEITFSVLIISIVMIIGKITNRPDLDEHFSP